MTCRGVGSMRFAVVTLWLFGVAGVSIADDGLQLDLVDRLKAATVFVKVGSGELQRTGTGFLFTFDGKNSLIATNQYVVAPFGSPDAPQPKVSVIFFSGQPHELTVDAVIAAADKDSDLAVLRFSALQEVPKPLDVSRPVELRETMSVYAAGFPFGSALSQTKGNPSVSISKGSISSLQRNERGELGQIVLECGLHPGNSGSPVIDASGRLVGVAVAK